MLKKTNTRKIKRVVVKKVKASKPKKQLRIKKPQPRELHRQYANHWLKITK